MHAIICCNLINAASPVEAVKPNNTEITPNVHIQILCGRDDPQCMPGIPGINGRDWGARDAGGKGRARDTGTKRGQGRTRTRRWRGHLYKVREDILSLCVRNIAALSRNSRWGLVCTCWRWSELSMYAA